MVTAELHRARQTWRAAEARLFPLAMTDVDGYQRALVLVADLWERLRADAASPEDLVGCEERAAEYVAAACEATGAHARGLDIEDLYRAAAASRDRELAGDQRRRARLVALDEARGEGRAWADIHDEGLGRRVPGLRVHVATGWAILTEVGADESTGAPVLLVTTGRLDLATGGLVPDAGGEVHAVEDAGEWDALAAALQAGAP